MQLKVCNMYVNMYPTVNEGQRHPLFRKDTSWCLYL